MNIIDLDTININNNRNNFIALGNFDGMHRAHTKIISNMIEEAKNNGANSSILLFKEHTSTNLYTNPKRILTDLNQKIEILSELGIDRVFIIDFAKIKDMTPLDFLNELLVKKLDVKGIYVGFDYRYGNKASGDIETLKDFCKTNNIMLNIEEEIYINNHKASSSFIRELIYDNKLMEAEATLGRKYWLNGVVIEGKKLGSKLGFPTANISLLNSYALPSTGVYISEIKIDNQIFKAATSLGYNYTFDEKTFNIEANILGFSGDLYGKSIEIRFIRKLRDMKKFNNIEELVVQVNSDIKITEEYGQ